MLSNYWARHDQVNVGGNICGAPGQAEMHDLARDQRATLPGPHCYPFGIAHLQLIY